MKNYTEKERLRHLENWENRALSKAEYVKSVWIIPTTFYSWAKGIDFKKNKKHKAIFLGVFPPLRSGFPGTLNTFLADGRKL